jgi:predicted enzyme related to lactoylglutathione lyase
MKALLDIPVILAENYVRLVDWYRVALPFDVGDVVSENYHYTVFENSGEKIVGVADAREMGVQPPERKVNTVIYQIIVSDIHSLFSTVQDLGGRILFGPKTDEDGGCWYGGFLDIEGNQVWASENKSL